MPRKLNSLLHYTSGLVPYSAMLEALLNPQLFIVADSLSL
jgi:hypothetical protein